MIPDDPDPEREGKMPEHDVRRDKQGADGVSPSDPDGPTTQPDAS